MAVLGSRIGVAASILTAAAAPAATRPLVDGPVEALAQDAAEYARRNGVAPDEAMRRLRAQEESVAATDALRREFAERLAGVSIEHRPEYRIVVLLTGSQAVAERTVRAGGIDVPVVFRTGARSTRAEIIAAMTRHRGAIRTVAPGTQGMGLDPRTGEIVLVVKDAFPDEAAAIDAQAEAIAGVPVRVRVLERSDSDMAGEGGSRVVGIEPLSGRRMTCTTGFVVTDGSRTGITTAAHCPDELIYQAPDGSRSELAYVGAWGARYQDVQIHVGTGFDRPLFYADAQRRSARTLISWRNRESTRAGDAVCHRGERTGYSCSEVELTDYAPPGELCGGPCDPVWLTVTGPSCNGGDSGGPVFSGGVAFGILKGGSYTRSGRCNFYFYMSTDFLPEGWTLLHAASPAVVRDRAAPAAHEALPQPHR